MVVVSIVLAAISTLRNVSSSQAQFQATGLADENHDGVGEFGGFLELSGGAPVREGPIASTRPC